MLRQLLILALSAAVALGHQELSDLYKLYKASGNKVATKSTFHDLKLAMANTGDIKKDKDLFAPPHPSQSTVDYHPMRKTLPKDDEPLVYYSWHVHLYFFHEDVNVTNRMLDVRSAFLKRFPVQTCDDSCFMGGWMDNCTQGLCTWDPIYGVDGPHPYGQWASYVPNEYLLETLAWFSLNHGEFEIFFHPNTGYMVGDHDPNKRAIWIKKQVPLDLNFLIWLQCEWFGCSLKEELEAVQF